MNIIADIQDRDFNLWLRHDNHCCHIDNIDAIDYQWACEHHIIYIKLSQTKKMVNLRELKYILIIYQSLENNPPPEYISAEKPFSGLNSTGLKLYMIQHNTPKMFCQSICLT